MAQVSRQQKINALKNKSFDGYAVPTRMFRAIHLKYRNQDGILTEKTFNKMSGKLDGLKIYNRTKDNKGNIHPPIKSPSKLNMMSNRGSSSKNSDRVIMKTSRMFNKLTGNPKDYHIQRINDLKKNYGISNSTIDNSYRKGTYKATNPNEKVKLVRTQKGNKFIKK